MSGGNIVWAENVVWPRTRFMGGDIVWGENIVQGGEHRLAWRRTCGKQTANDRARVRLALRAAMAVNLRQA